MDLHETLVPASANACIVLALNGCGLKALFYMVSVFESHLFTKSIDEEYSKVLLYCWVTVCAHRPGNKFDSYWNVQFYII